jgi:hypothetical protein
LSCQATYFAPPAPVAPARPVQAGPACYAPQAVDLIVRNIDGEWADILVDGLVVAELYNDPQAIIRLSPGVHTIEAREFMDRLPYYSVQVDTGCASMITMGIAENAPFMFYDRGAYNVLSAW